ncbi:hypothetical protein [Paenibacillus pinihumi]|uniref:hypothetical protein n=1 Tax=Paenibacillus pinihumi TaxID=669462 RepID=UPI000422B01E|nr:hypothetical protein [Paenibacillus pinihumi]
MSQLLDAQARENGTRFMIYPQNKKLKGFEQPEVVYINLPPGSIQVGPEDDRMYVVDAKDKHEYRIVGEGPRYSGPRFPPVQPNEEGHFDHIHPDDRAFSSTVMYATVRRVLDIWEDYFGEDIKWFFHEAFNKLELIPRVEWNNAQSGNGFLEFGFACKEVVERKCVELDYNNPYCENFDVLAHEMGHTIKNSIIGWPQHQEETEEYHGHHEAFGDLIAIVSVMHFDTVIEYLLSHTKGNLFSKNELSRVGELDQSHEIRMAFNDKKMSEIQPIFDERTGRWVREEHELSKPFTGGAFDVLVDLFQLNLIEKGLIAKELGERAYETHFQHVTQEEKNKIQQEFEQCYQGKEREFKDALLDARDYFGRLMASAWRKTEPNDFYYWNVVENMIRADQELSNGKYEQTIRDCFVWREINATATDRPLLNTHIVNELIHFPNSETNEASTH